MSTSKNQVALLFQTMLGRQPTINEADHWIATLERTNNFFDLFEVMINRHDYVLRQGVATAWIPGHFYSPIVDPATVTEYVSRNRSVAAKDISGIDFDIHSMFQFWLQHKDFLSITPFKRLPQPGLRFNWDVSPYPIGDAVESACGGVTRANLNYFAGSKCIDYSSVSSHWMKYETMQLN